MSNVQNRSIHSQLVEIQRRFARLVPYSMPRLSNNLKLTIPVSCATYNIKYSNTNSYIVSSVTRGSIVPLVPMGYKTAHGALGVIIADMSKQQLV